jgi:hypothetical protein
MTAEFINILADTFENIDGLNLDKLRKLTEETVVFVQSLQDKLGSKDPAVQEEAKSTALELKQYIEQQMARLAEKSGLSYEDLMQMANNPEFKMDAWGALHKLEDEMVSKETPRKHSKHNKTHLN